MDDTTLARLQEIEARYQTLDSGPWQWQQSYEIGNRVHWALESPQSAAARRVVSALLVLYHCHPKYIGEPVTDDPYLQFIACSRDDIEWLCQQVRQLQSVPDMMQRIVDALESAAIISHNNADDHSCDSWYCDGTNCEHCVALESAHKFEALRDEFMLWLHSRRPAGQEG